MSNKTQNNGNSNGNSNGNGKRCPVSLTKFMETASPEIPLSVTGVIENEVAERKEFQSGSFGWAFSGKGQVEVDGRKVWAQINCNVVLIGSKDAER